MHPSSLSAWEGEAAEPPTKFSQRRGSTGYQLLEGVDGKKGVTSFRGGGCNFHIKNKLKSEIFNDKKKFISKNIFLCHN